MEGNGLQGNTAEQKMWDFYDMKPNAPIFKKEFGFYVLDRWIQEGHLKPRNQVEYYYGYLRSVFGLDGAAIYNLGGLGGSEPAFIPAFEMKVLEDRGNYELVQDHVGRGVLCFKGRRNGFMPEYVSHPVVDQKSWEENVA